MHTGLRETTRSGEMVTRLRTGGKSVPPIDLKRHGLLTVFSYFMYSWFSGIWGFGPGEVVSPRAS